MATRDLKNSSFMAGFTESYLADVGRIVAGWSHVEGHFDILFLSVVVMLGAPSGSMKDPRVRLLGHTFLSRVRQFRERLGELELSDEDQKTIYRILSQLVQLRSERDEIAHALLSPAFDPNKGISPDAAVALVKSWRNEKPPEFKPIDQARLKKTFDKIHSLYWDLVDLSLRRPWSSMRRHVHHIAKSEPSAT